MELILARHGETSTDNLDRLSSAGRDQALVLAFSIKNLPQAFYCSEVGAEYETIQLIEESRKTGAMVLFLPDLNPQMEGEGQDYFKMRILKAYEAILQQALKEEWERIMCVLSLDVLRILMKERLNVKEEPIEFPLGSYQAFTLDAKGNVL